MNRKERRAALKQGNAAGVGDALAGVARQLEEGGKTDEGMRENREALAINSAMHGAANNLGNLLRQQGRLDEAFFYLESAIRLWANNPVYHNNLGTVYLARGMFREAASCFQKATALDPKYSEAHN